MKFLIIHCLLFLGISKAFSGTESVFIENVTKTEAADTAGGCNGCGECSGTERPTSSTK